MKSKEKSAELLVELEKYIESLKRENRNEKMCSEVYYYGLCEIKNQIKNILAKILAEADTGAQQKTCKELYSLLELTENVLRFEKV